MPNDSLAAWTTQQLIQLGSDEMITAYLLEFVKNEISSRDLTTSTEDEICENVVVFLSEWLPEKSKESRIRARKFADDLIKYSADPCLLDATQVESTDNESSIVSQPLQADDTDNCTVSQSDLKATAQSFMPTVNAYECIGQNDAPLDANDDTQVADDTQEQDEDDFIWSIAAELVMQLQRSFPDVDELCLFELLYLVDLDTERAETILQSILSDKLQGSTQVCRHFLQGNCHRSDCMFLHDTQEITCRFWLKGSCLQDIGCEFAHTFVDSLFQQFAPVDVATESLAFLTISEETSFPALVSDSSTTNAIKSKEEEAALNFARAIATQSSHKPSHTVSPFDDKYKANYAKMQTNVSTHGNFGTKWVVTGKAVTSQYRELRQQAYELACARNKCFMKATNAYRSENKALAKSLSRQGHAYNNEMKKLHLMAATEIFETRNPPDQVYGHRLMDLHGLHVEEAIEFLYQQLPLMVGNGLDSINIVTGSGHHSKGAQANARLLPAVKQFLDLEQYQYDIVPDRKGYVGMLHVRLS